MEHCKLMEHYSFVKHHEQMKSDFDKVQCGTRPSVEP